MSLFDGRYKNGRHEMQKDERDSWKF